MSSQRSRQQGQALLAAIFFSLVILLVGSVLAQIGVRNRMQFTYAKQAFLAEQVAESAVERASATVLYAYNFPTSTATVAPYSTINTTLSPWTNATRTSPVSYDYLDPTYNTGSTARSADIKVYNWSWDEATQRSKKPWIFKIDATGKVPLAQTSAYGYTLNAGQGYIQKKVTRFIYVVEDLTFGLMSCGQIGFGAGCNGGGNAVVNGNVGWGINAGCESSVTNAHVPPPNKKRVPVCPPDVSGDYVLDQNSFINPDSTYSALVVNFPDSGLSSELDNYQTYADRQIMKLISPWIDPALSGGGTGSGPTTYKASALRTGGATPGQSPAGTNFSIAKTPDAVSPITLKVTVPPGSNGIALYRGTTASNHTLVLNASFALTTIPTVITVADTGGTNSTGFTVTDLPPEMMPPGLAERVLLAALHVPGSEPRFHPWDNSLVAMLRDIYWNSTVANAAAPSPVITSLTPNSGPVGTTVDIAGSNFGNSAGGGDSVKFNGVTASIVSWTDVSIRVTVPGAATTGNVVVTNGGQASSGTVFTVTLPPATPTITTLSPSSGSVGTDVVITGSNFGDTQSTSTVTFNGAAATPSAWSATSITVSVPSSATTGNVIVTVGGQASNGNVFNVTTAAATVFSMNPQCGIAGSATDITGANFGTTQGTSSVTVGGDTAAVSGGWTDTSIGITVPATLGVGDHNVVVTVDGQASNPFNFAIPAAPTVTSVVPGTASVGATVMISGNNFTSLQGTNTVTFNGVSAPITNWSNASITVAVPTGATTGNVVVNACGRSSAGVNFTVSASAAFPVSTPPTSNTSKELAQASPLQDFVRNVAPYLSTTYAIDPATGQPYPVVPVIVNIGGSSVTWNANGTFNMSLVNIGHSSVVKYWKDWCSGATGCWPTTYGTTTSPTFQTHTNPSGLVGSARVNGSPVLLSTALGLGLLIDNITGNGTITFGASGLGSLVYVFNDFGLSGNWTLIGSLMISSQSSTNFIMTGNSNITYDSYFVSLVNSKLPGFLLPTQNMPMIIVRRALQAEWGN